MTSHHYRTQPFDECFHASNSGFMHQTVVSCIKHLALPNATARGGTCAQHKHLRRDSQTALGHGGGEGLTASAAREDERARLHRTSRHKVSSKVSSTPRPILSSTSCPTASMPPHPATVAASGGLGVRRTMSRRSRRLQGDESNRCVTHSPATPVAPQYMRVSPAPHLSCMHCGVYLWCIKQI